MSVGRVVEEEAMVVDWGGEGERVGAREVLVDMGEINIVSSFKDKTCKCLLNEEGFIPGEVDGSMCCSNWHVVGGPAEVSSAARPSA